MKYSFHPQLVIRTPLRPFKKAFNRDSLKTVLHDERVREALFLSSPELLAEFEKTGNGFFEEPDKKLSVSLLKYIYRMHSRCTPFGLFAGCGAAAWGNSFLIANQELKRSTRLDMQFTCALVRHLEQTEFIRPYLKYYPNTSLYHDGNKLRYVEYFFAGKKRVHQLCEVEFDEYIERLISCADKGITLEELMAVFDDDEQTQGDIRAFANELIDGQLLVSELEPSVTGGELLESTLRTLVRLQRDHPDDRLQDIVTLLLDVQRRLQDLDLGNGNEKERYLDIAARLDAFNVPYDLGKLFQTDSFRDIGNTAAEEHKKSVLQQSLLRAVEVLRVVTPPFEESDLGTFKKLFFARYEYQEVPLLEALDNEWGIGYGAHTNHTGNADPFLESLNSQHKRSETRDIKWDRYQSFLFRLLLKARAGDQYTVTLSEADVKGLEDPAATLPATLALTFSYVMDSADDYTLLIKHISGPSANHMLGRFAAVDDNIRRIAVEVAETEKEYYGPSLIAVLSHLPESRTGNVLVKPMMRDLEIAYLSNKSHFRDKQIALSDLYLSIRNDKLYLRSRSLNQEIIPRIDNAHNFRHKALPLYHFLGDLQFQGSKNGLYFHWGALAGEFKFLPRVEIGRVIVFRATWQLSKIDFEDIYPLLNADPGGDEGRRRIFDWRTKYRLPALVLLIEADNELLINFEDEFSLRVFGTMLKNRESVVLKEFLFDDGRAAVRNEKGEAFTNEMIAVLKCEKGDVAVENVDNGAMETADFRPRSFPIGSEWLYFKVYCGKKTADALLQNEIRLLTAALLAEGIADHWFFIRYNDPDPHIRLRIHLSDPDNTGAVIQYVRDFLKESLANNLIWKLQTDTYSREVERYGKLSMTVSELVFFHDSVLTVNALSWLRENFDMRLLFAINAADQLAGIFGYGDHDKLKFFGGLERNYLEEFGAAMRDRINKLYREKTAILNSGLDNLQNGSGGLDLIINNWRAGVRPLADIIIQRNNGKGKARIDDLVAAHIHMLLNRVFRGHQRVYETVIYAFLHRMYRSKAAKADALAGIW
ncbi:lantibiotic dehydratase [Mucilaginibacter endophyticus]|uniref:lantibiotic dehydratase n=1 Tax=Mucilaginibacter endophyticus TaxID=2675003 RepID=UPI000E0D829A|nr:lantibiotic dehydratase [Mucilaginibacter endophyticus]